MPSSSSTPRLTLPAHSRRPPSRLPPAAHLATAAGWLLFAVAVSVFRLCLRPIPVTSSYAWPVTAIVSVTTAIGLLFRASWARFLVSVLAGAGAIFMGAISLAAFYPTDLFWWPGALFVGFCAWTLFFTVRLWPDYLPRSKPAA